MQRRHDRIELACKDLAEEAFKAYTGKKDYKRALEIYTVLAAKEVIPPLVIVEATFDDVEIKSPLLFFVTVYTVDNVSKENLEFA